MPIYEYRCQDCQALFELMVSNCQVPAGVKCTKCGSRRTQKTISAASYRVSSGKGAGVPAGALTGCASKKGFS
ncbi:FmdB family zinc ribbon protein [Desulfurivibrio dismutans]|uniref:FmdB family zinc ribbon protein n=1 Tax=Desulfurivibrio dismutans TaxID=1398908 RepID=UPI0023DC1076|nr:zinc ribbon domain-containing protein [Desulfurivibrio alkaliphilus]MDF1615551.1 zinc ribbon domain-containing protein [Desulfurivibrio alkaliphilus]